MNPFALNTTTITTTTSTTTLTNTLKEVTSLRSARSSSGSGQSRSYDTKQEFSRRQSQLLAQSMIQSKPGRKMAMFMKNGSWLVQDLSPERLPRCGRFKCWVESKHHPGYGYTISQHFRSLKKDKQKHSKYDKHVMLSTYGFVKQLSVTNGFEQLHHTYPVNLPPKSMSPNDELFNFMTQQMDRAKQLVEKYETSTSQKRDKEKQQKSKIKRTKTDINTIVDVVTEDDDGGGDGDGDDDDDDGNDNDEGEGNSITNKSYHTDNSDNDGGDNIPELVREKKRIKGYLPTKPWLVQPLQSLPNPESSFTFRYLDQLQHQNLALQTEKGVSWVRSRVLGEEENSDTRNGQVVSEDDDGTSSRRRRLLEFATMLQSQTVLTLKLLWEVEPRLNADFQIWITKTGEIWHYDFDRIFGSSPRQLEEATSHQPSFELVKFIKFILRENGVAETPILDDYYNNNIQSALVWNNTAEAVASTG